MPLGEPDGAAYRMRYNPMPKLQSTEDKRIRRVVEYRLDATTIGLRYLMDSTIYANQPPTLRALGEGG